MKKLLEFCKKQKDYLQLGAITLFGLVLRLTYIGGKQPYMGDEVLSLTISKHFDSIRQLVQYIGDVEFHPPLFYIIMHFWVRWFGESPSATHILSAIFSIGVIVLTYVLCKILFESHKVSLLASFLVAILPIQLEYSQSARPYAIMCFLGVLVLIFVWKYYHTYKLKYLIGYVITSIVGLYLHYSFFLVLSAVVTWSLFQIWTGENRFRKFTIWVVSNAAIILGFGFWMKNFLFKILLSKITLYGFARSFVYDRPSDFFEQMFNSLTWLEKPQTLSQPTIFIFFLGKLVLIGVILVGFKSFFSKADRKGKAMAYLSWNIIVPISIFLFTPFSFAYYAVIAQHIILLTVPLMIIFSVFFFQIANKKVFAATLMVVVLTLVPSITGILANDGQNNSDYQFQALASFINEQYQPGDMVLIPEPFSRVDLEYYLKPEISVVSLYPIPYFGGDYYKTRDTLGFFENETQTRIFTANELAVDYKLSMLLHIYKPKRVWLVFFQPDDYSVHHFFLNSGWSHKYGAFANFFLLDMYEQPTR